jgi:hypothetical protein
MKGLRFSILLICLASAIACRKGELLINVRSAKAGEASKSLGILSYDIKGSLSTANVEITDIDLYTTILKDAEATCHFEFKHQGSKLHSHRTAVK